MIETITQMIQDGLKLDLLFTLFQLMVAVYILMLVKAFIVNEVAWYSFKSSLNICINTWVRITTPVEKMDGRIVEANRRYIVVETKDTRIYIYLPRLFLTRIGVCLRRLPCVRRRND